MGALLESRVLSCASPRSLQRSAGLYPSTATQGHTAGSRPRPSKDSTFTVLGCHCLPCSTTPATCWVLLTPEVHRGLAPPPPPPSLQQAASRRRSGAAGQRRREGTRDWPQAGAGLGGGLSLSLRASWGSLQLQKRREGVRLLQEQGQPWIRDRGADAGWLGGFLSVAWDPACTYSAPCGEVSAPAQLWGVVDLTVGFRKACPSTGKGREGCLGLRGHWMPPQALLTWQVQRARKLRLPAPLWPPLTHPEPQRTTCLSQPSPGGRADL